MLRKLYKMSMAALAIACCGSVKAQMMQTRIASANNRNEIITVVRTMPNGDAILGGYIYDVSNNAVTNADMILLRVSPTGTILWQRQIGTPNSTANDLINGMSITKNGEILVVGTMGRNSAYANNTGAIFRFDGSGNLIWDNYIRIAGNNAGGEVLNDVTELGNGNIVAVGAMNFIPGSSGAMICGFTSGGAFQFTEDHDRPGSDEFFGVTAVGNDEVVITGWHDASNYKDSRIVRYRVMSGGCALGPNGWERSYSMNATTSGAGNSMTNDGLFGKPYIRGGSILSNATAAVTWSFGQPSMQTIFRCDLANGTNPQLRSVLESHPHANNTAFYPVDADRYFVAENPANSALDATLWLNSGSLTNAVISEIQPFLSTTALQSREFNHSGNQSILSLDMLGSNLYMGGCTTSPSTADNDVFFVLSQSSLTDPEKSCDLVNTNIRIGTPTQTQTQVTETPASYLASTTYPITIGDPRLQLSIMCGKMPPPPPPPGCDLQCYWRVDGNGAITPADVFGTMNAEDIRFVTAGQQRAVLENTDGRFGLNTPAPTARLHVNCQPQQADLSDIRFENLGYSSGEALVIDPNGYVYRSMKLAGKSGAAVDSLTQLVQQLQQDVAYLMQAMRVANGGSAKQTEVLLYPNPASSSVELEIRNNPELRDASIVITAANGQSVLESKAQFGDGRKAAINTSSLAPGTYFVKLYNAGKLEATKSFVIAK